MHTATLTPTEAQEELRETVRRFFERTCPPERLRELVASDTGYDRAAWDQMAGQLGLHAIAVPEEYGGMGYGLAELAVVLEEMGRMLVPGPFLGTALLAVTALQASGDEPMMGELLPAITAGECRAAVATTGPQGSWLGVPEVMAAPEGDGWLLSGRAGFVIDALAANTLLVFAATPAGEGLFVVDPEDVGLTRRALASLDPTRRLAALHLDRVPARPVGAPDDGQRIRGIVTDHAAVGLAAELVGVGQRSLDLAVDYAKNRYQFGRAIAGFQAIKHMAAEMAVSLELARSQLAYATAVVGTEGFPAAASFAKSSAGACVFAVTVDAIQIHGGLGFTEECDLHFYYKRAKSNQLMFGDEVFHRQQILARTGL